jgi:hypothetical protein
LTARLGDCDRGGGPSIRVRSSREDTVGRDDDSVGADDVVGLGGTEAIVTGVVSSTCGGFDGGASGIVVVTVGGCTPGDCGAVFVVI